MISRLSLWIRCLHLLCVAILIFSKVSVAILVTDEDAAKKNLDSIYVGTIVATLKSTSKPTSCFPQNIKFGPYSSSQLRLGPVHNGWYETNPFFLAMVGGEQGKFLTSVQSSLTSTQGNETWWSMEAWQYGGKGQSDYEVHGAMVKDVDNQIGEERNQLSGVWEVPKSSKLVRANDKFQHPDDGQVSDPCAQGTKHLLIWRHKMNTTTIKGQVGANKATIIVSGTVVLTIGSTNTTDDVSGDDHDNDDLKQNRNRLVRREETQEMSYTLTFSGTHHSSSAPMPMQGLVWDKPGSGPTLEPFQFFTLELPKAQSQTSAPTSTREPNPTTTEDVSKTTIIIIGTESPWRDPSQDPNNPALNSPLPRGAVVGIVVGGVLAIAVFLVMIFLVKKWLARRNEPKVYPELAYIYSTPFTSVNKRSRATTGGIGASSATVGGSGGSTAHKEVGEAGEAGEAGTYYGPTAPQLEVDLSDQTPFLESTAATAGTSSAGLRPPRDSRVVGSGMGRSTREEEMEEMEREMRQPMLAGAGTHYEEPLPSRSRGGDFSGRF